MTRLLRESMAGVLPSEEMAAVESGIDVIGDIAILRLSEALKDRGAAIGEALLRELKNVKVVLDQEGAIGGEYRLRKLRHLAGENRTLTIHKENGCRFKVDVETCYFSPRLSTERLRIADAVKEGERVLNMFAGAGPFSITIGRKKDAIEPFEQSRRQDRYFEPRRGRAPFSAGGQVRQDPDGPSFGFLELSQGSARIIERRRRRMDTLLQASVCPDGR